MRAASTQPRLSVVVATTEGWPAIRPCLESLRGEAARLGVEIVVADGSGRPAPSPDDVAPGTVWMRSSAPTVFELYAHAYRRARGAVVASTEDHCTVRPGWCEAVLRAHDAHPEAIAIGGAIENGSTATLLDWGSYFITQGPHMAPLGDRKVPVTSNEACLSFKRVAVESMDDGAGRGLMMILYTRRLREAGQTLRVDDRIVVDHFQSLGVRETSAIHFHNGRSIAGFRRRRMGRGDWLRVASAGLLPPYRTARGFARCFAKGRFRGKLVASLPWQFWLELCQGAGHLAGYAFGPGDSPRHLR